jgi:outer membrane protein insertion porin family
LSAKFTPTFSMFLRDPDPEGKTTEEFLKEKYKWVEYHKWNLDMMFYTPLSKDKKRRIVMMNKANFGLMGSYSSRVGTGPFERFVLGGTGMMGFGMMGGAFILGQDYIGLRGYDDNSRLLNEFAGNSAFPIGGIAFSKLTSEVRFLVSDNPMATIFGLGFFEAGNNFHSYREIDPYSLRRSFGAGIRLFMPMFGGLIGYDIAFPLDDPYFNGRPKGHFSLGMPFR